MSLLNKLNADADTSETSWSKTYTETKEVAFFVSNMDDRITQDVRHFLQSYSGIPRHDIVEHVYRIREKAWAIRAYPCTGFALFLQPMLPLNPAYPFILERVRNEGANFIDVGCFVGQDLRRLVFDGCPPSSLFGCDIVNHWDVGFEFYRDKDRPFGKNVKYIEDDMLHPKTKNQSNEETLDGDVDMKLMDWKGQMDIINAALVLHHWNWDDQVAVCKNLVRLSRGPESMIVGCQIGSTGKNVMEPHCEENPYGTFQTYWHNPETWKSMWAVIAEETGTKWEAKAELKTFDQIGWRASDWWYIGACSRVLQFVVKRLE